MASKEEMVAPHDALVDAEAAAFVVHGAAQDALVAVVGVDEEGRRAERGEDLAGARRGRGGRAGGRRSALPVAGSRWPRWRRRSFS